MEARMPKMSDASMILSGRLVSVRRYADRPSTLYWIEAQDGGDPRKVVDVRDIVYSAEIAFEWQPGCHCQDPAALPKHLLGAR